MSVAERLTAAHAELLAELERSYPEGMRQGLARLQEKLSLLERSQYSFSWVLREGRQATAYLIAYPQKSMVDVPRPDTVCYIDDLQVTPGNTGDLYQLLKVLAEDLESSGFGHLHVEALCRRSIYRTIAEHPAVVRRVGYELLGKYEYWEDSIGEEMCWMRWEPTHPTTTAASPVATSDMLELSSDLYEELELDISY